VFLDQIGEMQCTSESRGSRAYDQDIRIQPLALDAHDAVILAEARAPNSRTSFPAHDYFVFLSAGSLVNRRSLPFCIFVM